MRRGRLLFRALAATGCGIGLTACQKPLFPANLPRTQFEKFDQVRNETEPQSLLDEFGRRHPNVGGRLDPK